jgi:hypothetical protein
VNLGRVPLGSMRSPCSHAKTRLQKTLSLRAFDDADLPKEGPPGRARRLMEQPPRDALSHFPMVDPVWLAADDRNRDEVLRLVALDHDERVFASGCGCL